MLANGQRLPDITGTDLEGNAASVAELTAGTWSTVLLYRGHW